VTDQQQTLRSIRSYVLRQGRMTEAQRLARERLLPRYGIPYCADVTDLTRTFARVAPTVLEIGFGMGESTAAIAAAHPQINYVGVEVHSPGVGSLLRLLETQGLTNVRIVQHDAMDVVATMVAPDSLAGVHVFFPDPWPKKRHHKRRLLQPAFAQLLAARLTPGGYLHVATDWQEYADWMLAVLTDIAGLTNTADGFAPRPEYRPLTKFERRGLRLGHAVRDIVFRRTSG
jgi:tRNA (guanine-N7-)-methyltransferase